MKIGFLTHSVPGHLHPFTALARRVQARGHNVAMIGFLDGDPLVRAAKLPFIPFCEQEHPEGAIRELVDQLSELKGQEAVEFTFNAFAQLLDTELKHLPRVIKENHIDALVIDESHEGLELVPMHMGIPYVHYSAAMHFDFTGNTPLCILGWPHENTPEALARNKEGVKNFAAMRAPLLEVIRAYAHQAGLKLDWEDPLARISKLAWLTQTPKEFDLKSFHWPSQFHYTGPAHDGLCRIQLDFPWDRLTGEPLIYASMGTLRNGLEPVFTTIAEAVGERPGTQIVMSVGPILDVAQIKSLPKNAIVVNSAPQIDILKRSTLCITHAGLNTTLESLERNLLSTPNRLSMALASERLPGLWHCVSLLRSWDNAGVWTYVQRTLYEMTRIQAGQSTCPSVVIMDSQAVKTTERSGVRGFDAHKRVKGRKRHILVDTSEWLIACRLAPADISDRTSAIKLLGG